MASVAEALDIKAIGAMCVAVQDEMAAVMGVAELIPVMDAVKGFIRRRSIVQMGPRIHLPVCRRDNAFELQSRGTSTQTTEA